MVIFIMLFDEKLCKQIVCLNDLQVSGASLENFNILKILI